MSLNRKIRQAIIDTDISQLTGLQALSLLKNCFEYIKIDRENKADTIPASASAA